MNEEDSAVQSQLVPGKIQGSQTDVLMKGRGEVSSGSHREMVAAER